MNERKKTLILCGITACVLVLLVIIASSIFFLADLEKLEKEQVRRNMGRVTSIIANEISALHRTVADWAVRDETSALIDGSNPAYLNGNLSLRTFIDLCLDSIVFSDTDHKRHFGEKYVVAQNRVSHLSVETQKKLLQEARSSLSSGSQNPRGSIALLQDGPVLVSSHAILPGNRKGPSRGVLVMTRRLDAEEAARIGRMAHVTLSFHSLDDPLVPTDVRTQLMTRPNDSAVTICPGIDDKVAGYFMVNDSSGKSILYAKIVQPANLFGTIRSVVHSHLIWISVVVGIILALLGAFLVSEIFSARKRRRTPPETHENLGKSEFLARSMLEVLPEHIAILDNEGVIIAVNRHWREYSATNPLVGKKVEEGANYLTLCERADGENAEFARSFAAGIQAVIDERKEFFSMEFPYDSLNERLWFMGRVSRFCVDRQSRLVIVQKNITELKDAERDIRKLAYYDPLTELPNRLLMHDRLNQSLARANRTGDLMAVLLLDLDYFKLINDSLGHTAGDRLLTAVASRLSGLMRKSDTLARMGGDEFIAILNDVKSEEDASRYAKKLLKSMSSPFEIGTREVFVGMSIGIALYPIDSKDKDKLLKNAETAMYQAKKLGRNICQFFSSELNLNAEERLAIETSLRYALERDELLLNYQPLMDLKTGRITGVEALLRWQHPIWGLVPPDKFIPVAEETGLLVPVGEWVLRTACSHVKTLHQEGFPSLTVAVNLSGRQVKQYRLVDTISDVISETGLDPACLELEITESSIMENVQETIVSMHAMKELGVHISIDDFGTGYSSLNYLKCFPLDKIKIDQSFVRDIPGKAIDTALTQAIIAMARSLQLKVIAEGVETAEQLAFLKENGCDEVQGYHISPPVAIEEMMDLLVQFNTPSDCHPTAYPVQQPHPLRLIAEYTA
jgi:diguanylate cyclase (GGDEF)-like protein